MRLLNDHLKMGDPVATLAFVNSSFGLVVQADLLDYTNLAAVPRPLTLIHLANLSRNLICSTAFQGIPLTSLVVLALLKELDEKNERLRSQR